MFHSCASAIQCEASKAEEKKKKRRKKNLGRGQKRACEKRAERGRKKTPLSQTNGPGRRASEGPCDPPADKIRRQNPRRGGGQPSALDRASPGPHLGEGAGAITRGRPPRDHGAGPSRKSVAAKQNRRGKRKTRQEKHRKTLAASRPKKRASEGASELKPHKFKENPKNARGPEWHPEKNAKKQNARPKRAKQKARRDTKREKEKPTGACGGVLLLPDLYLLKKRRKTTSTKKKPKEERTSPKNTRPDIKRIFSRHFRERPAKI